MKIIVNSLKLSIKDICTLGVLISLGIVLSAVVQFRLIGDIKVDLSYLVIIIICYLYGGFYGMFSAGLIALFESLLFSAYGISISWISANLIIGLITGIVLHIHKENLTLKVIFDVLAIIISCTLGLLIVKTVIECNLYGIPFEVKIVKNSVAFGIDCGCMVVGYFCLLPKILQHTDRKVKNSIDN